MTPYMDYEELRAAAKRAQQKMDLVLKSKIDFAAARLIPDTTERELRVTELAVWHDLVMLEGANEELRRALYPASDAVSVLRLSEQETAD